MCALKLTKAQYLVLHKLWEADHEAREYPHHEHITRWYRPIRGELETALELRDMGYALKGGTAFEWSISVDGKMRLLDPMALAVEEVHDG